MSDDDAVPAFDGIPVALPSGAIFTAMTEDERAYVAERVHRYETEFALENVSDLAQLDLMIELEALAHRYADWLARGCDYQGEGIDDIALRRSMKEFSGEIRAIKKALGVDKVSRDKEKGGNSVPEYLEKLRSRALRFGYMRNQQFNKGLDLSQQLIALITLHDNCIPEERAEFHVTQDDVFQWIRTVFVPEFQAIDEHFRNNDQVMWAREM